MMAPLLRAWLLVGNLGLPHRVFVAPSLRIGGGVRKNSEQYKLEPISSGQSSFHLDGEGFGAAVAAR